MKVPAAGRKGKKLIRGGKEGKISTSSKGTVFSLPGKTPGAGKKPSAVGHRMSGKKMLFAKI